MTTWNTIKNIQGPCGNSRYESLFLFIDSQPTLIPRVSEMKVIIKQPYSSINGYFGTVKIIRFLKFIFSFVF